MLHRHLNHSEWTLAAIDDVIARGRLNDWEELRDAAASRTEIQEQILRVSNLTSPIHTRSEGCPKWHDWNRVKEICATISVELFKHL